MKIVSLLPSATEIVFALGLGSDLVGVTDECDFPAETSTLPVVSRSPLPPNMREPGDIDAAVSSAASEGRSQHSIDAALIGRLQPDLILTQDLCRACDVPSGDVKAALAKLESDAEVVSLDPHSLEDVFGSFVTVGRALGREDAAEVMAASCQTRVEAFRMKASRLPSIRVLAMDWSSPPWAAGRWVPEMVELSGGANLLSTAKEPSVPVTWKEIADATPEIIAVMPCGYYIEEAEEEAAKLFENPDFANTPAAVEKGVFAADATSFFSRPGPRLIDGLEALAWAIHPEAFPEPPPGTVVRVER
jgi:iron complex transport system substrate-binding protein